jgi:hypothetical protein
MAASSVVVRATPCCLPAATKQGPRKKLRGLSSLLAGATSGQEQGKLLPLPGGKAGERLAGVDAAGGEELVGPYRAALGNGPEKVVDPHGLKVSDRLLDQGDGVNFPSLEL